MATPQAVLDAEAEADRLIAEMAGQGTPAPKEGEEPAPTPETAGEPKDEAPDKDQPAPADEGRETVADTAEVESLRAQLSDLQERFDKLQVQHDTLRGKTYAEVPRVISENKQLRDQIAALEVQLAAKPVEQKPLSGKSAEILQAIKGDVSDEVADNINRLVNAIVEERVSERIAPVEGRVSSLQQTSIELAEEKYLARLTQLVPDWRRIASTPEYSTFLSTKDELSGVTLYDMAKAALDRLDADHMARFYNKFLSTSAKPAPQTKASGKEVLVQPKGAATTAREEAGTEKPDYITVKQMDQFNRDRRERRLTEKQEAEMEVRIDRAIQKGWIVP